MSKKKKKESKRYKLQFGKYRDKYIDQIPNWYLKWILEQDWFERDYPNLMKEANEEFVWRKKYDVVIKDDE